MPLSDPRQCYVNDHSTFMELFFSFAACDISAFLLKQLNGYREYTNRLSGNTLHAASRKAFSHYKPDVHRQKGWEEHLAAGSRGSGTTISTKIRLLCLRDDVLPGKFNVKVWCNAKKLATKYLYDCFTYFIINIVLIMAIAFPSYN